MVMEFESASQCLTDLSVWIDKHNSHKDREAQTWARLSKVGEEFGEVVNAYIGVTNQNPRKGEYSTMDDVAKELLDVALTALAAYVHVTGSEDAIDGLEDHIIQVWFRAGLCKD